MADFRIGTENIQGEAGTSYIAREQESTKHTHINTSMGESKEFIMAKTGIIWHNRTPKQTIACFWYT